MVRYSGLNRPAKHGAIRPAASRTGSRATRQARGKHQQNRHTRTKHLTQTMSTSKEFSQSSGNKINHNNNRRPPVRPASRRSPSSIAPPVQKHERGSEEVNMYMYVYMYVYVYTYMYMYVIRNKKEHIQYLNICIRICRGSFLGIQKGSV